MNFVGLPKSSYSQNAIWIIVNHLTYSTHFLSIKTIYSSDQLTECYINGIVRLHGALVLVVPSKDPHFT